MKNKFTFFFARPFIGVDSVEQKTYAVYGALTAIILVFTAILSIVGMKLSGVRIVSTGIVNLNLVVGLIILPFAIVYTTVRFDAFLASLFGLVATLAISPMILVLFTYYAAILGEGRPLADAMLDSADKSIGFDWTGLLFTLNAHPALAEGLRYAYYSPIYQIAILGPLLVVYAQRARLQIMLAAFVASCAICCMGSAIFPAIGAYPFYGVDSTAHDAMTIAVTTQLKPIVMSLREGSFSVFSFDDAQGIVAFPSFHSVMAILLIWVSWPLPWLRWPFLAANLAMLAATPIQGAHYLVDILAGILVAVASLWFCAALRQKIAQKIACADVKPSGLVAGTT